MFRLPPEEIIEHLHDDIVSHGFLSQCLGLNLPLQPEDMASLRGSLFYLLSTEKIEIGSAFESSDYVEFVAWSGSIPAKVERALEAVAQTPEPDSEFAYWICLKEKVDRYEADTGVGSALRIPGTFRQLAPAQYVRQTVNATLNSLGGQHGRDGDDRFWIFEVPPFQITIANPRVIELPDLMEVVFSVRVSESEFSKLVGTILNETRSKPKSMLVWEAEFEVKAPEQAGDLFGDAIRNEFAKVAQLDVQTLIRDLAADLPDRPLGRQIDHLAALAWRADYMKLEEYVNVFRRGKRLNFIPYIEISMIERALNAAYDRVS